MDLFGRKAKAELEWTKRELESWKQEAYDQRELYHKKIRPLLLALGRVIATDKAFIADIGDPDRKAKSDKLAMAAIDRIIAEDEAARHSTGEP